MVVPNALSCLFSCMDKAEEPSKPTPAAAQLLYVGPVNQGNNKNKYINSNAILSTVLVEAIYLQ